MAVQPINPRRKVVKPASGGSKGGAGLGQALGAAAGGVIGGLAGAAGSGGLATAQGAMAGAAAGGGLGAALGGGIAPARQARGPVEEVAPQVQLTASQEARRSQELLAGLQAIQNEPSMGSFASPLTQAYIKSMTNLKQMG